MGYSAVFKGTRIMVHMVLDMLAAGETPEEVVNGAYPQLTMNHIRATLEYASHTAQEGHISFTPLHHEVFSG